MTIHLYSVCWNERELLGFFFRHYSWVDRFVIFDDGSTDGTVELLEAHPKVDLRRFERSVADSFAHSHVLVNDHAWKESRGTADWVVLADIDEHFHLPDGEVLDYLSEQRAQGVTFVPGLGFDLHARALPPDTGRLVDVVRRGRAREAFNKIGIFDPDAVTELRIGFGRHLARPVGDVRLPSRDELMLWHYKHLGLERWGARDDALAARRGPRDVAEGLGIHLFMSAEQRVAFWDDLEATSYDLGGPGFEPDQRAERPLWWEQLELERVRP